jgi:two-component system CheB/CheR fusion protein
VSPYADAEQMLLDTYAPVSVLVDENLKIVHTRGKTGHFLELAAGDPDLDVLKMARPGLLHGLRSTLHEARHDNRPVRKEGLKINFNGHGKVVDLAVYPIRLRDVPHFLIAFEDAGRRQAEADAPPARAAEGKEPTGDRDTVERLRDLQEELDSNREYLQATIQDLEAANEELQSANEEILSSNEELQSTNEELDTAKEELQSTNEELNTVNDELHGRNQELSLVNSDLLNLLSSVDIAIVMVSLDLRIRRFTPKAGEILNLIMGDIDRPIDHIKPNIDCPDLPALINNAIDKVEPKERDVCDVDGHWYSLRIRPYKDIGNRINGAVLTLVDIDAAKRQATVLQKATEAILQCVDQPILLLNGDLTVQRANQGFLDTFRVERQETEGQPLAALGNGQWDIPELRDLLERVLPERKTIEDYRVTHDFPLIGRRAVALCARAIEDARHGIGLILLAITDVSDASG